MSLFDAAFGYVLGIEGHPTNDPRDPGGLTRWGIAQNKHPEIDVANLTLDGAKQFYQNAIWTPMKLDFLPTPLNVFVFDSAVNQGNAGATKVLQKALGVQVVGVL